MDSATLHKYISQDDFLSAEIKTILHKIVFLALDAADKKCYASNHYFANLLGKSERTVRLYLQTLKNKGYISISLKYYGKRIISRTIEITKSLFEKAKTFLKKVKNNTRCLVNEIYRKKKDNIYKYILSKKERKYKNQRPENYEVLAEYWKKYKLTGNPIDFWNYNSRRGWTKIRNWMQAAVGFVEKSRKNISHLKTKRPKNEFGVNLYKTDYENILPYSSGFCTEKAYCSMSSLTLEDLNRL